MRGLTLEQSENIIKACKSIISEMILPPMTVVVLDSGGVLKVAYSEDGSGTLRYKIAFGKANASLGMGFNSGEFSNYIKRGILSDSFAQSINGAASGDFIPVPGGCLIIDKSKKVLGAIGISGASSHIDEEIAINAINQCGLGSEI